MVAITWFFRVAKTLYGFLWVVACLRGNSYVPLTTGDTGVLTVIKFSDLE